MTNLTDIAEAIIALAVTVITAFLIPWIRSKTTAEQREDLLKWADIAVAAAQQLFYHYDGDARLSYALSILEEKGFDINSKAVCDAIEAAVLTLHQTMDKDTLNDVTPPAWSDNESADEEASV